MHSSVIKTGSQVRHDYIRRFATLLYEKQQWSSVETRVLSRESRHLEKSFSCFGFVLVSTRVQASVSHLRTSSWLCLITVIVDLSSVLMYFITLLGLVGAESGTKHIYFVYTYLLLILGNTVLRYLQHIYFYVKQNGVRETASHTCVLVMSQSRTAVWVSSRLEQILISPPDVVAPRPYLYCDSIFYLVYKRRKLDRNIYPYPP